MFCCAECKLGTDLCSAQHEWNFPLILLQLINSTAIHSTFQLAVRTSSICGSSIEYINAFTRIWIQSSYLKRVIWYYLVHQPPPPFSRNYWVKCKTTHKWVQTRNFSGETYLLLGALGLRVEPILDQYDSFLHVQSSTEGISSAHRASLPPSMGRR